MALYRKYRPASFAEMIGQEQVTRPLSTALDNGRVNHAYLFSGPRGTGKTSSARILARSLNCVQGPTSTPCGVCPSCVALAPGGPGNLDVTEMDAASNGGVDEMRELRERAYFAPAESRYRVFIIDEAHMITGAGANALLKIVEEPPEHLVFIFATTEPEKIIGTIRSRTHHYPFRLLTPQAMRQLVERTVAAEGVTVDENVYPLVIRAGGGSPRDTLSILDQLLAGAGPEGLTYELALPLLGVTDLSLIDATVDALSSRDASALFQAVDDVIEAGHEPRRFAIDLLDRLRDLMIIHAVPDAFGQGLVDAPADRAEILTAEADKFPGNQLAALATEVNERITSLRGATSPRLLLEIMMAHLLGVLTGTQAPAAVAGLTELQDASAEAAGMGDKPRGA
ncbi:DNA polymerase III subunit gamma and tau, partial [Corynebacterium sp. Marseille-P3884]|uniref:DNA polymerase III subunit gamma and tau n=1 Tax=Corynebacterium sp. Marseille-P3884 TaxID=2495409 RepID=UPI001B33F543|nr:DNA polymerase III subunit gamma and tau [Corynebacterium sp. Marseille-P3884]